MGHNKAPTAQHSGPYTTRVGVPVVIDATASFDPDGDPVSKAHWIFKTAAGQTVIDLVSTDLTSAVLWHTPEVLTIRLTVIDGRGATSSPVFTTLSVEKDPPEPIFDHLDVTGPAELTVDEVGQFQATAVYSDGSTVDVTATASWETSDPIIATVTAGTVFARSAGTVLITASVPMGVKTSSLTVNPPAPVPDPRPVISINVSPAGIDLGQSATTSWTVLYASSITASGDWSGSKAATGTEIVTPGSAGQKTYTLTAVGSGGTSVASAQLVVTTPQVPPPTLSLSANPTTITIGQSTTLTWSSTNATSAVASGAWTGSKAVNGSEIVTPGQTGLVTYILTVTGSGGSAQQSVSVTVNTLPPPVPGGLIQQSNLVYAGAFRVPTIGAGTDQEGYAYGGQALAYNPAHNSLFLAGFWGPSNFAQRVGEISIPALGTGAINTLNTAANLQTPVDITEGRLLLINPGDPNAKRIGGIIPFSGQLAVTGWSYYDGAGSQVISHFVSGVTFSVQGDIQGAFQVGTTVQGRNPAGFVAGYMATVPAAHQAALGGAYVTGQCCIAILSRTSSGPALFSFNPSNLGVVNPVPVSPLVYYDINHQTLGGQYSQNALFNGDVEILGVAIPEGFRSVLFFGRRGANYCYGVGTSDFNLNGTPVPGQPGVIYCYDPEDSSKGSHSWPKQYYVWAYDINDMAAVRSGQKLPWQIVPYATWAFTLPYTTGGTHIYGAAYDPATHRIYIAQGFADGPNLRKPVIHVFTVT